MKILQNSIRNPLRAAIAGALAVALPAGALLDHRDHHLLQGAAFCSVIGWLSSVGVCRSITDRSGPRTVETR